MVTSPYEWRIVEWDVKSQTKKTTTKKKIKQTETTPPPYWSENVVFINFLDL